MNAVIYARYSSDKQREESIEGQVRECRAYADRNGIDIVGEYIDRAKSASKNIEKREDFLRMIRDSKNGTFDIVLVWKVDRFARDEYDYIIYKRELEKNGVKVISATELISDSKEGKLMEAFLRVMAEIYSDDLSEKVKRGHKDNAIKCLNNGGPTPFGYEVDKHKLVIDPVAAPVVQEIYQRYADGETIQHILDDLNAKGIRTSKGNKFTNSSFNTILKNRAYIGEYIYDGNVTPGGVPAIIPQELFDKVQARREKNKHAPARTKAKTNFLLTTKLICGHCGAMVVGDSGRSKTGAVYHYYKCGNAKRKKTCDLKAVRKDWIEDIVIEHTMLMLENTVLMERLADRLVKVQGEESYTLKLLQRQLGEVEEKIKNMLTAIQMGIITTSTKDCLNALEAEKTTLQTSIAQEQADHPILTREQIRFFLQRFRHTDVTDPVERQRLIDCFVNAVYLYEDKIVLVFNYKDGTKTISLKELECSDLMCVGSPRKSHLLLQMAFFIMICVGIERAALGAAGGKNSSVDCF